jgi:3',5'-cyclic AMP phosphodiesterase CpdA
MIIFKRLFFLTLVGWLLALEFSFAQSNFRILPYLQVSDKNLVQIRWFSDQNYSSSISIKDSKGNLLSSGDVLGMEMPNLYYTDSEKSQTIAGLQTQNWIGGDKYFRYEYSLRVPFGENISYEIQLNGQLFANNFKSAPDPKKWENIRFIALSDSETEPIGRVTNRAWYPGIPLIRFFTIPALWKQKFGTTFEEGLELPNYFLTETQGYTANLEIINSRKPDFMLMPGDLVQGGGYMPAWDEFWRHNSGEFGKGLSSYPIIPAIGNWESFGALNNGYGINERGQFNPVVGRSRFHSFFEIDSQDSLQKHRQSYYRTDFGPITILTLDSSNGTPEEKRSDTSPEQKLKNREYTGPGTDTQENYTLSQYNAAGGTDLSGFGPGTDQYHWLVTNLKEAKDQKKLIFVQFHHIPYGSGEHGVPMNHELSTGQGGTPMRILHPLFEEYGVIAVLAGHDELFERSFVDQDGDGKGVHYYDVGVAGDGLRGVKRNWISNPLATLNYNEFSQWTADQKSIEQWNTSGPNPVLTDGGKHYGHLEVNLKKIQDGGKTFAQIDFDPVYAFPVMDQNYNLQRIERRVYNDQLRILVQLEEDPFEPIFKKEIGVELDENGKVTTTINQYLQNEPRQDWKVEFSRSLDYTCVDLPGTEIEIKITDSKGNIWKEVVPVKVKDLLAPKLITKIPALAFDLTKGELLLKAEDFVSSLTDNCGIKTVALNKTKITCENINTPIELILTVGDLSGNITSEVLAVNVTTFESSKISISPESEGEFLEGQSAEIRLGEEFDFTVLGWYRNGQLIEGQKGKAILTKESGTYWAKLVSNVGGCEVESKKTEIKFTPLRFGQIKESVTLILGLEGKANLNPSDIFDTWPPADPSLEISLSKTLFTCDDIGEKEVGILIKKSAENIWEKTVIVIVKDQTPPVLISKNISLNVDITKGAAEISPETLLTDFGDNCGIKSLTISKSRFTCEDIGKGFSVVIRAEDSSGNVTEKISVVSVESFEPTKVLISGQNQICEGQKSRLELSSSELFEVIQWRRDGVEVQEQRGKSLEVSLSGVYQAVIRYQGGCLAESKVFEVKVNPIPKGEISVDGNILRAPEGDYTYQWFRNGEKLEGKTARTFTAELMGEYAVDLTSSAGCKATLKAVTLTISSLFGKAINEAKNLKIYPIPASDRVTMEFPDGALASRPSLSLYSSEGKNVTDAIQIAIINDSKVEIILNRLANGTYLIWVIGQDHKTYFGKIVILN